MLFNNYSVKTLALLFSFIMMSLNIQARPDVSKPKNGRLHLRTAEVCSPATSTTNLDINNVRAMLHNGGDMWWDLVSNPKYEVPKVDDPANAKHSMFAGSLWIGGKDASGQLRIAAQTYRQTGNDFFPGPVSATDGTASTEKEICAKWDKHFKINKESIDKFRSDFANGTVTAGDYPMIFQWPATGSTLVNSLPINYSRDMAPFVDVDGDDLYDPTKGDYPDILGDQAVWWVLNDKGDIHTETNGEQIGIEIQMMAFGFATTNAVNNMTFYKQKVINRSGNILQDTYIGQWCDPDLGFYADDYVGCDTVRGLGVCYNGDAFDDLPQGYGANPPAIGVDFFQGPIGDDGERIGMAKFIYYNNNFTVIGNPEQATHFYGYLTGFWKNNTPVVDDRGGNSNGYPDQNENTSSTNYMFPDYPGSSQCPFISYTSSTPWKEGAAPPFDRRFIQSAGPFTLQPGAVNDIVVGLVWARDENGQVDNAQFGSFCLLLQADDIAQALFDANFEILDGPDAPDLAVEEYDQELILRWDYSIRNATTTNNYYENYAQYDPTLVGLPDTVYRFEGYLVYQLLDDRVSATELRDPSKARLIAQCDIKNDIKQIVNRSVTNGLITDQVMVDGRNSGLFHTLKITEDAFAEGANRQLVNYRPYYFTVIAYAHNGAEGNNIKFIQGRGNYKRSVAQPHKIEFEKFGTALNSRYGDGPNITRVDGSGSGGNFLRLTQESENAILQAPYFIQRPVYAGGFAPIDVTITNPKEVKPNKYRLEVVRDLNRDTIDANSVERVDWLLKDITAGGAGREIYASRYVHDFTKGINYPDPLVGTEKYIVEKDGNDQVEHGFSVTVRDVSNPGLDTLVGEDNGYVGAEIVFNDLDKAWLSGLPDNDQFMTYNWIRSGGCLPGTRCGTDNFDYYHDKGAGDQKDGHLYDPQQAYEDILGKTWSPYTLAAHLQIVVDVIGPALKMQIAGPREDEVPLDDVVTLDKLPNIDVVITTDPTKWSRCVVVETSPSKVLGSGAHLLTAKWRKNITRAQAEQGGFKVEEPEAGSTDYGMSWFPGYAINLDNGERLNIFFGEGTWYKSENGDDMLFNPTQNFGTDLKAVGGRHYIYVSNTRYDECAQIAQNLRVNPALVHKDVASPYKFYDSPGATEPVARIDGGYKDVAWTSVAMSSFGTASFKAYRNIPTDVRVALRVGRKFSNNATYEFDMTPYATGKRVAPVAESAVKDLINVVPNPYYARSGVGRGRYEKSQLDTRAKITNLPQQCQIRIYTLSGVLVRTFNKDSELPDQEWDLKNDFGVPIASGLYIIHIKAEGIGEKVLKFFAIMPEVDLNAY